MIDRVNVNGPQFQPRAAVNEGVEAVKKVEGNRDQQLAQHATQRQDSVELSDAARALALNEVQNAGAGGEANLSPDRVNGIVERLQSGFYNSDGVVSKIASGVLNDLNAS